MSQQINKENFKKKIFYENPYDIETFLEGLEIASKNNKELIFMDRVFAYLRLDPTREMCDIVFEILEKDLNLVVYK
jgi:hypothetical protein